MKRITRKRPLTDSEAAKYQSVRDQERIGRALESLRLARNDLFLARAVKSVRAVRRAIKSAEGALRHAQCQETRATMANPQKLS